MMRPSKAFASLSLFPTLVATTALFVGLPQAHATCGSDRPCFDRIYMEGENTLVATWHEGNGDHDFNQFRYSSPGGPEPQAKVSGSEYRIHDPKPGATYTLKVQSCEGDSFGGTDCTPWDTATFTVPKRPLFGGNLDTSDLAGMPRPDSPVVKAPVLECPACADRGAPPLGGAPTPPATPTATVTSDVDVYNAKNEPDGAGHVVGMLATGKQVQLVGPCQPQSWCQVSGDAVPGGQGWVWGALQF
jgi:hypothetical protein